MPDGFVLESMAEQRRATPVSVAAHSLDQQADPYTVYEPEGRLDLSGADYTAWMTGVAASPAPNGATPPTRA